MWQTYIVYNVTTTLTQLAHNVMYYLSLLFAKERVGCHVRLLPLPPGICSQLHKLEQCQQLTHSASLKCFNPQRTSNELKSCGIAHQQPLQLINLPAGCTHGKFCFYFPYRSQCCSLANIIISPENTPMGDELKCSTFVFERFLLFQLLQLSKFLF